MSSGFGVGPSGGKNGYGQPIDQFRDEEFSGFRPTKRQSRGASIAQRYIHPLHLYIKVNAFSPCVQPNTPNYSKSNDKYPEQSPCLRVIIEISNTKNFKNH